MSLCCASWTCVQERAGWSHVEGFGVLAVGPVQAREHAIWNKASPWNPCNGPVLACWPALWVATSQRASVPGVNSQGGFRTRPLTNHVSPFAAGPEGRIPVPAGPLRRCFVPCTLRRGFSTVRLFRLPHCLKKKTFRDGKGRRAPSGWLLHAA